MKYTKVLAASKATEIVAAIPGLPVAVEGYILTSEELDNIEEALQEQQSLDATITSLQDEIATAKTEKATLETSLNTANTELATAKAEVERLKQLVPPPAVPDAVEEDGQKNQSITFSNTSALNQLADKGI